MFDSSKCNFNQNWNNDKTWCECKIQKNISAKEAIFGILQYEAAKMVNMQEVLIIQ